MSVRVIHGLDDLARDQANIAKRVVPDCVRIVREAGRVGNVVARDDARRKAGRHGKHYPRAFSSEMKLFGALGLIAVEYGPDASKPQGDMSFEGGSRNQKPHLSLAKSSDLMGPALAGEVRDQSKRWFE